MCQPIRKWQDSHYCVAARVCLPRVERVRLEGQPKIRLLKTIVSQDILHCFLPQRNDQKHAAFVWKCCWNKFASASYLCIASLAGSIKSKWLFTLTCSVTLPDVILTGIWGCESDHCHNDIKQSHWRRQNKGPFWHHAVNHGSDYSLDDLEPNVISVKFVEHSLPFMLFQVSWMPPEHNRRKVWRRAISGIWCWNSNTQLSH